MRITDTDFKDSIRFKTVKVKDCGELIRLCLNEYKTNGKDADLNFIDVSDIEDMSHLFINIDNMEMDISEWDVRNVRNFDCMFAGSGIATDLSMWEFDNAATMNGMFRQTMFTDSAQNSLKHWTVGKVRMMSGMFANSNFNGEIGGWDVSNVIDFSRMFEGNYAFNRDISSWNVKSACNMTRMFYLTNMDDGLYHKWVEHGNLDPNKCYCQFMFDEFGIK